MKIAFNECFTTNEADQTVKTRVPVQIGNLIIFTGTSFLPADLKLGETPLQKLRNKELIVMMRDGIYSIEGFYY